MCGICGIFGISDREKLKEMNNMLVHRGPDDEGYYVDKNISLGFRRLSIIDLETGNQPISNEDKTIWTVTNGEIYNYKELRRDLITKGHIFYTKSDIEVIVHLYEEMGERCFEQLNGIYGIAIYDKNKQRLLLARDRFGVKPLYYAASKNKLYFASEIKSIVKNTEIQREISAEALFHFMTFRYIPTPLTIYKDIYSLRPAHFIIFNNIQHKEIPYWRLALCEKTNMTEDEMSEELYYRLENAVKLQLMSDVPIGSFLSGGIDSGLITAFVRKLYPEKLSTFTLSYYEDFIDKKEDERLSELLSKKWETNHYIRKISPKDYLDRLDRIVWHFDQPFSHAYSPYFISEIMRDRIKVAISGDGADEIFGNYFAHRIARPIYNYAHFSKDGRINDELLYPCQKDKDLIKRLSKMEDYKWRLLLYNMYSDNEKKEVFSSGLFAKMKGFSSEEYIKRQFESMHTEDPQNRIQEYELKTLLVDQILEFNDKLTMANSIECRVPYLENDFFSFAASIPGELRIKKGITKFILKKTASRVLPKEIINRIPSGFQLPTNKWMKKELKADIITTLSAENMKKHNFFRYGHIKDLLFQFYEKNCDTVIYKVWNFYCFQKWYNNSFKKWKD